MDDNKTAPETTDKAQDTGKVTPGTIARTIVLALALANEGMAIAGLPALGIEDATIYELVSLVAAVGASIWAWWKNNSWTASAIAADEYKAKHAKEGE
jgi:SPP1 family holin